MTTDRAIHIHTARVYLRESRLRRSNPAQRGYTFLLLEWAADQRRRAAAINTRQAQGDLFGGIHG